jgi:hypothetical protein
MEYNYFHVTDVEIFRRLAIINSEFYGYCSFCYIPEDARLTFTISLNDVFCRGSDAYSVAAEEVDEIFDILMGEKNDKAAYDKVIAYIGGKLNLTPLRNE